MKVEMKRKQIVLFMTDSTRHDMVGCYGREKYERPLSTPHIDAIAEKGIRFDRAYTCQPVCGPARSALFTGMYPHSNGSFANCIPLGANVKSIGMRLSEDGIKTAYIGKWHLDGGDYFGMGICPEGWDPKYWYDMRNYLEELSPEDRVKSRNPKACYENGGIDAGFTYGHRCSERGIDFIHEHKDEDFLLVISYDEPHDPYLCPEPYASMYKDYEFPVSPNVYDDLKGKPEYQRVWAGKALHEDRSGVSIRHPLFFGCQSYIDSEIGRVCAQIQEHTPDAMVIYTSDHGDALKSHRISAKGPAFYDEIARVPLIISCPSMGVPEGVTNASPLSHIDIAPTILEYLGVPVSKVMEGKSLLPTLEHNTYNEGYAFTEFTRYEIDHDGFGGYQPMRAVTDGRYKLSVHLLDVTDELYDTQSDPHELNNLINDETYNEIKIRLHEAILDFMNRTRDPFRGYQWARRPWRARLDVAQEGTLPMRPASWDNDGLTRQREDESEPRQLDYQTGLEMQDAVRKKG